MASSAETHKTMAAVMTKDLVKPLKTFAENQHKSRKGVESHVDKTSKILLDWRTAELKTKAKCHTVCKENERVQDAVLGEDIFYNLVRALSYSAFLSICLKLTFKDDSTDVHQIMNSFYLVLEIFKTFFK